MIFRAEQLIEHFPQIIDFIIVNADKNSPIVTKQIPRQQQPRIHHRTPIRMETASRLGILHKTVSFIIEITVFGTILFGRNREVVSIYKVTACVVRGIDVDQLHLAGIGCAHDLEGLEVVTLDVEVLGGVPVLGLLGAGAHDLLDGAARFELGLTLAGPGELVALARAVHDLAGEVVAKGVEVDGEPDVAVGVRRLGHHVGEERGNLGDVLLREVGGLPSDLLHRCYSSSSRLSSACFFFICANSSFFRTI